MIVEIIDEMTGMIREAIIGPLGTLKSLVSFLEMDYLTTGPT